MKKTYLLSSAAALMLLMTTSCKDNGETPVPDPVFNVETTVIQAAAEGGVYEIAYTLENPAEDGELKLESDVAWVNSQDYSVDGKISVTVDPNMENADRNANLSITYTYGDGETFSGQVVVHQVYAYDVNTETAFAEGGFFYGRAASQANYAIYFSDLGTDAGGTFLPECTVYRIDVHSDTEPSDYTAITLPEGTYTLDDLDIYNSFTGKVNAAGDAWEYTNYLTDITLTVTKEGEDIVVDGVVTTDEGKVHHLSYNGPMDLALYSAEGYGLITQDYEIIDPHLSDISYVDDNGSVMAISMQISGTPEGGDYMNPYTTVFFEIYAPYDDYKLLPGTYTVGETQAEYTLWPGYVDPASLYVFGTYAMHTEGSSTTIALLTGGTVEVSESNDIYTVEVKLTTDQGFRIYGTWTGEIYIDNIPGNCFSTLDGDYTVKMDEINYTFGSYYGDEFGTGGSYYTIEMRGPFEQDPETVLTQGTGEAVYFEVITNSLNYDDGIISGTYTVAEDPENPQPGEYLPGTRGSGGMNLLSGTYYTGGYEAGYVNIAAPAIDGDLNITNHGDGTYTLDFAFLDDRGNTWDGHWTGALSFMNWPAIFGAPEHPNYVERRMAPAEEAEAVETPQLNIKRFPELNR